MTSARVPRWVVVLSAVWRRWPILRNRGCLGRRLARRRLAAIGGDLDIGANYGAVGLLCRDAVLPSGRTHLFEPQPDLCRRMRACVAEHGLDDVVVHEVALLDREATLELSRPASHSGSASVVRRRGADDLTMRVRAVAPATYLPPLVGDRPWGAKLDVEGAEPLLLPRLVALPRLRFIVLETRYLRDPGQAWETLRGAGLAVFGLRKTYFAVRLARLQSASDLPRHHDAVAVRPGSEGVIPGRVGLNALRALSAAGA